MDIAYLSNSLLLRMKRRKKVLKVAAHSGLLSFYIVDQFCIIQIRSKSITTFAIRVLHEIYIIHCTRTTQT